MILVHYTVLVIAQEREKNLHRVFPSLPYSFFKFAIFSCSDTMGILFVHNVENSWVCFYSGRSKRTIGMGLRILAAKVALLRLL
jgi:hypothetical protein